jgi:hypothetical protein
MRRRRLRRRRSSLLSLNEPPRAEILAGASALRTLERAMVRSLLPNFPVEPRPEIRALTRKTLEAARDEVVRSR